MTRLRALALLLGICPAISVQGQTVPTPRPATPINSTAPGVAGTPARVNAQDKKPMDITPYKLPDEAFWASPKRGVDPMATALVGRYEGLLIDAPRRIFIDQRSTLPAGVYQIGKIRDVSSVRFKSSGLVAAMDVMANRLMLATSRSLDPDDDPLPQPAADPSLMPEGNMSATESLELRRGLKLAWKPARLMLTAVLRDQVSNRVSVELCQSPACFVDPEVVKYLEAELARRPAATVTPPPGKGLPSYKRSTDSLQIPEQNGIELGATRVSDQAAGQPWLLWGAFRLRPTAQEWVKAGWQDPYFLARPDEARPVAVVAIWLLLVGANDSSAHAFALQVPSWTRQGDVCTGQFSIDLRSLSAAPRIAQTYFVYAFSGESMAGPLPSALIAAR